MLARSLDRKLSLHWQIIRRLSTNSAESLIDAYGRPFPPKKGNYYVPSLTCDAVVVKNNPPQVLMITRKNNPYQGYLAFPGGFVDYNEDPANACLRELKEETGIIGHTCDLLTVKGNPMRDPREHIVSIFYHVSVDEDAEPVANDDAADAKFYQLSELLSSSNRVAFDHLEVLQTLAKNKN